MSETISHSPTAVEHPAEIHYVAVDQSYDAMQLANDESRRRLTEELNEGSDGSRIDRAKGWLKNHVWKGGVAKEGYEAAYSLQVQNRIRENGGDLHYQATEEDRLQARLLTVERFMREGDDFIHTEAGESRERMDDSHELVVGIKDLIRRNVEGALSNEALLEERTRLLNDYQKDHGSGEASKALARADNMLEIAAAVRGAIDHGEALDSVLENMKFTLGESRSGVRSEARFNKVESIADKVARSKVGALVSPEVTVAAATLVTSALSIGAKKGVRKGSLVAVGVAGITMPALLVPVAVAGVWAGVREAKRSKEDRVQHAREMAQGSEIEGASKRREQMEATRYNSASASELIDGLNAYFGEEGPFGESYNGDRDRSEALNEALAALGSVEARIQTSDARDIDLITYSSADSVEDERLALDIARAEAKTIARQKLEDAELRQMMGIDDAATLENLIDERAEIFTSMIEDDISQKDRVFQKLKNRRAVTAGVVGGTIGLVVGVGAHEVMSWGMDKLDGVVEVLRHGQAPHETLAGASVEALRHNLFGDVNYESQSLGDHGTLLLGNGMELHTSGDGIMSLQDHDGSTLVDHIELDAHGNLTPESIASIKSAGINFEDLSHTIDVKPENELSTVGIHEFLSNHENETVPVQRDIFFDNDTPTYSDGNELRLLWGGEGSSVGIDGSGITADGSYQLSVASMIPGDSFHDGSSPAWPGDHDNLRVFVSASVDGQTHPFEFDVNPDGTINIPTDSPAAQLFRVDADGHAEFIGKYVEVAQVNDVDADGLTHISPLATAVGTDEAQYNDFTIEAQPSPQHIPEYRLTANSPEVTVDPPPIIPIVPRRPLESLAVARRERPSYPYGYDNRYGYGESSRVPEEATRAMEAERSPTIAANPEAVLYPRGEFDHYRQSLVGRRGEDAVEALERTIAANPQLSSMSPQIETIVTIPVGAAFESENIFNTLSLYSKQEEDSLEKTLILLNVNRLDAIGGDSAMMEKVEKTNREIERARANFPQLNIAVTNHVYAKSDADATGGIIGYAAQDLVDLSILSLLHNMKAGNISDDAHVLIQRHDADMLGMHRRHLTNLQAIAKRYSETDMFQGGTRLDVRLAEKYPGWGVIDDIYNITTTYYSTHGSMHTGGANFAVRAEALAAVGGLGDLGTARFGSGAGSDDSNVGIRISSARGSSPWVEGYGSSVPSMGSGVIIPPTGDRKILRHVGGMIVDTNAERFLPMYLRGEHWHHAWTPGVGSFGRGTGGYGARNSEKKSDTRKESFARVGSPGFARLEQVFSQELSAMGDDMRKKVLSIFFREAPGSYQINTTPDGEIKFTLTKSGRKYVRQRMQGGRGVKTRNIRTYARKKIEGMYGNAEGLTSLGQRAPLVSAAS